VDDGKEGGESWVSDSLFIIILDWQRSDSLGVVYRPQSVFPVHEGILDYDGVK